MKTTYQWMVLLLGWGSVGITAPAATKTPLGVPDGRFRFLWQNDSWFSTSDRFYTNGIGFGWTPADGSACACPGRFLRKLPFGPDTYSGAATEFFVQQDMFTPEDFTNPNLVVNDRPYAGWLHFDVTHHQLTLADNAQGDRLDTWLLQVGIVGPSALAEEAQREVHELVGAPKPLGWDHQLHDELGIVLGYQRDVRVYFNPQSILGLTSDITSHAGGRIGNVDTSLRMGSTLRLGSDLPRHFGTAIRGGDLEERHRLYLSTGVEGRWVLRNIFLDGNTFEDSHSVERNDLVAEFHIGLHWEPCRRFRVGVREVFVTPEFDSPSQKGDTAQFTSVQLECFF